MWICIACIADPLRSNRRPYLSLIFSSFSPVFIYICPWHGMTYIHETQTKRNRRQKWNCVHQCSANSLKAYILHTIRIRIRMHRNCKRKIEKNTNMHLTRSLDFLHSWALWKKKKSCGLWKWRRRRRRRTLIYICSAFLQLGWYVYCLDFYSVSATLHSITIQCDYSFFFKSI